MKRICLCLMCQEQFGIREIGKDKVDRGYGVCPKCGGRISRTDSKKLFPVINALGDKNFSLIHSGLSFHENPIEGCKSFRRGIFIWLHFAIDPSGFVSVPSGYKERFEYDKDGVAQGICLTKNVDAADDESFIKVVNREIATLMSWIENLPKLATNPSNY